MAAAAAVDQAEVDQVVADPGGELAATLALAPNWSDQQYGL
jgi:hypothetical protein